jgi:hypothetical protein
MASFKEKLVMVEPSDVVMLACQRAAASMKWKVLAQERTRFAIRETQSGEQLQIPVQIEMKILPVSGGSGVELNASNVGFGSAQNQRVQAQAAAFMKKVRFELDRPNMERRQQEIESERQAQIQREREADDRAAIEEAAQRAKARAAIMQQLHGVPAAEESVNLEGLEESTTDRDPVVPSETPVAPERHEESLDALMEFVSAPARSSPSSYATLSREPQQAAAPASTDLVADLERLANLHKMGALTEEEFRMAKRKLLRL